METVLTFESVDEILWCDHSNETSSAVLLHGTIYFLIFYKMKVGRLFPLLGVKGLKRENKREAILLSHSNWPQYSKFMSRDFFKARWRVLIKTKV